MSPATKARRNFRDFLNLCEFYRLHNFSELTRTIKTFHVCHKSIPKKADSIYRHWTKISCSSPVWQMCTRAEQFEQLNWMPPSSSRIMRLKVKRFSLHWGQETVIKSDLSKWLWLIFSINPPVFAYLDNIKAKIRKFNKYFWRVRLLHFVSQAVGLFGVPAFAFIPALWW